MYKLGLTVFPVCPTCILCGISSHVSTAARLAPTAAPIVSAITSRCLKLSGEPIPRPPEMMMFASATSSLSLALPINSFTALLTLPVASTTLIEASPSEGLGENTLARTDITAVVDIATVWNAFPE